MKLERVAKYDNGRLSSLKEFSAVARKIKIILYADDIVLFCRSASSLQLSVDVMNMKISAVRSLADICFLHVLFGILIVLFN